MARLRKFVCYRRLERPYTRISKFKKKSFIRADPAKVIVRFDMGDDKKQYDNQVDLVSKQNLQIRSNALESARQTSNRLLEKVLGPMGYYFKLRVYPHHILRENKIAAGAGADRFSTGMSHSFGIPTGTAAQIEKGQVIAQLRIEKTHLDLGLKAMNRMRHKLPGDCAVVVTELKKQKK